MSTEQERIEALAQKIRDFNIIVSGGGNIAGGFGEIPPAGKTVTIDDLEKAFNNFNLVGEGGISTHGNLYSGYAVHTSPMPENTPPAGSPVFGVPPPTVNRGACCMGTDCSIQTAVYCNFQGGVYQGDNIPCSPNPCGNGGPPPPLSICCGSVFQAFDGSCRFFLTKTTVFTATSNDPILGCSGDANITTVETYAPDTCEFSCSRSGRNTNVCTDPRNSCVTLNCFHDTSAICGVWTDHRISYNSHSGTDCVFISDFHTTNSDVGDACGNILINSGCCPPFGFPGACISVTATVKTASGTNSLGNFTNIATLSDEITCFTGACCLSGICSIQTECDCNNFGGDYQGNNIGCEPNPC